MKTGTEQRHDRAPGKRPEPKLRSLNFLCIFFGFFGFFGFFEIFYIFNYLFHREIKVR